MRRLHRQGVNILRQVTASDPYLTGNHGQGDLHRDLLLQWEKVVTDPDWTVKGWKQALSSHWIINLYLRNVTLERQWFGASAKVEKSNRNEAEHLSSVMYFAPEKLSGFNVCPSATIGCADVCLNVSGRSTGMKWIIWARIFRTLAWFVFRDRANAKIEGEIRSHRTRALNKGLIPACRLNGTSDIMWENQIQMEKFGDVMFYDYTKVQGRSTPSNYHLCLSWSERYDLADLPELSKRYRIAMVLRVKPKQVKPTEIQGIRIADGDHSDLIFQSEIGVIRGLSCKGSAYSDKTGFVVDAV